MFHRSVSFLVAVVVLIALAMVGPAHALTLSPSGAGRGESPIVHIYTPGTAWTPGVTVTLGAGITTREISVLAPELLEIRAAVDFTATLGLRDVVITQGETIVTAASAFTIAEPTPDGMPGGPPILVNAIVNPGFESGTMAGWIPTTWSVSTTVPHTGTYDAYDTGGSGGGGLCLRQNFNPPIDSDEVTAFTFWLRQIDDFGIAQVIIFHQNSGVSVGVAFPNANDTWTFEDFTSLRRPNDLITGCHVCGFGGGAPTPDDSWTDDFVLEVSGATAVESTTWGAVKARLRQR